MMHERRQPLFRVYFFLALCLVALYVLMAYWQSGAFGFPLDDAWIHQVYARNLGTRFEFSFFAGQPSAGSTSPLWAILLGVGYAVRIDFRVWTLGLGIIFLAASGLMTQRVMNLVSDDARLANWFAPLLMISEWHMVWAAASGMEIVLFVFLALALVEAFFAKRSALWLGLLAGGLTLTRPEGVLLAALVGLGLLVQRRQALWSARSLRSLFAYALMFFLLLAPYWMFNLQTSGTLLPNTFYAKSAEYAELTQANFLARWLSLYRQPLIGAQILLLPGLGYASYYFVRHRAWEKVLPALWIVFLPLLYAWRLPVEYQFGRYMMPLIPFVMIYGSVGTKLLFEKISWRVLRRAWGMTIAVLHVAFVFLGANFYAQSVAIVNCEMIAVANFTRANLPQGVFIAAHDIGAQEYFDSQHPMLDMAGLVSPEVIPFIRDEAKLKAWMIARDARYAIFFPTWYPQLARDETFVEIFSTGCSVTRGMGEENLRVYKLQ